MSFKSVQAKIAKKEGVSSESAGAILANSSRNASAAAKRANPKLKRVKGKMHEGGDVPETGTYMLEKGEHVVAASCHGDCMAPAHIDMPNGDGVGNEKDICDPHGNPNYYSGMPGTHGDRAHRAMDQWKATQTHPMVKQQAGRTEHSNVEVLKSEA